MFLLFIGILASAVILPTSVAAAEPCAALFEDLNHRHKRVEESLADSPNARRAGLQEIETRLFKALARCPTDAPLFALMGEVQIALGQGPLATVYGRKAVELDSNCWQAHQLLGSALAMEGHVEEGIGHLERAAELAPDNPGVRVNLASAQVALGQYRSALTLCESLVSSHDKRIAAAAHNIRGQAYSRLGELNAAAREFSAAEKLGFNPMHSLIEPERLGAQNDAATKPVR